MGKTILMKDVCNKCHYLSENDKCTNCGNIKQTQPKNWVYFYDDENVYYMENDNVKAYSRDTLFGQILFDSIRLKVLLNKKY